MLFEVGERLVRCHFVQSARAMRWVGGHVSLGGGEQVLGEIAITAGWLEVQWLGNGLLGTSF